MRGSKERLENKKADIDKIMENKKLSQIKELFLKNKTIKQTIFKNTFWLGLGTGLSKLLKLLLIMYVARVLGVAEYGKFSFALAFISVFLLFADLGLDEIVVREFSRQKDKKEFYSVLSLKFILSLGTIFLIFIGSFFVTNDLEIQKLIWILGFFCIIESFSTIIYVFFHALQKMEYQALATVFESLVVTGFGFFVIFNYPSIENLSYAYLLSSLIGLLFLLVFFHFKVLPLKLSWRKSVWKKFLIMGWPLTLASFFYVLYSNTDSIMMGHWGLIAETGWYNAAHRIVTITFIPMGMISASFYPMLSRFFKESKEKLQKTWSYQMELMILTALPIVIGGIALAPGIINLVYGSDFTPAILALQILIIMGGLIFLCAPLQYLLIACNQQRKYFWITSSAAIVNILLNFILIPKLSLYGAAIAKIITYSLIFFLFLKFTIKLTPVNPLQLKFLVNFITALISAGTMYLFLSQVKSYNLNIFLSIIIGAAIYLVSLLVLRKIFTCFSRVYA